MSHRSRTQTLPHPGTKQPPRIGQERQPGWMDAPETQSGVRSTSKAGRPGISSRSFCPMTGISSMSPWRPPVRKCTSAHSIPVNESCSWMADRTRNMRRAILRIFATRVDRRRDRGRPDGPVRSSGSIAPGSRSGRSAGRGTTATSNSLRCALAVNAAGQVVGYAYTADDAASHPFSGVNGARLDDLAGGVHGVRYAEAAAERAEIDHPARRRPRTDGRDLARAVMRMVDLSLTC